MTVLCRASPVAGPVKLPRVLMTYCRHSQSVSQRSDLMEGGRYSPLHLSAVSGGCGVGSYMLEASCPPDSPLPLPLPLLLPPTPPCKAIVAKAPKALTHRSTTLCGEAASSEPAPLSACSIQINPTVSEHHNSNTLLLCGDLRWQTGFANQGTPKLPRQHRQWGLPAGLVRDRY